MIIQMAMLGQGIGMIISSLTTKYRDLSYLVSFGTQLMMYASPIVYPLSIVPEKYKLYILANPMTPIIEGFRQAFIGKGFLDMNIMEKNFKKGFSNKVKNNEPYLPTEFRNYFDPPELWKRALFVGKHK